MRAPRAACQGGSCLVNSAENARGASYRTGGHSIAQPRKGGGCHLSVIPGKRVILRRIFLGTGLAPCTAVLIRQVEWRVSGTAFRSVLHRRVGPVAPGRPAWSRIK